MLHKLIFNTARFNVRCSPCSGLHILLSMFSLIACYHLLRLCRSSSHFLCIRSRFS